MPPVSRARNIPSSLAFCRMPKNPIPCLMRAEPRTHDNYCGIDLGEGHLRCVLQIESFQLDSELRGRKAHHSHELQIGRGNIIQRCVLQSR